MAVLRCSEATPNFLADGSTKILRINPFCSVLTPSSRPSPTIPISLSASNAPQNTRSLLGSIKTSNYSSDFLTSSSKLDPNEVELF
jgi:hypothetical protein